MTVILVLLTFVGFLLIDHFYSKYKGVQPVLATAAARDAARPAVAARIQPSMVNGFKVPDNVRYHPGHTWALSESPNLVRVGMDDFAGKLAGKIESINLPQRGQWIRQGQKIWSIQRDGQKVDMVSPIEGSVSDINDAVLNNPELARRDPYGDGWMVTVQAPDAKTNFRNLLGGLLAKSWIEEAAMRLQRRIPAMAGALMQDGGEAVSDLTAALPDAEWATVTKEFFLS
jgi:glycine cleavage system H lipoate-binding protein